MSKSISTAIRLGMFFIITCVLCNCNQKQQRATPPSDEANEAVGLEILREGDCWVANIVSPGDSTQNLGVYIFPDSDTTTNIPKRQNATVLPPAKLKNVLLFTGVYSSALKELGASDIIKAVGDASYFTDEYIITALSEGKITDVGNSQEPVAEKIIAAQPDVILVSHYDGADFSKIEKLGIPIIYLRESSEQTPLGRAEWIKLIGLIAGKKEKADSIYNVVSKKYTALKNTVKQVKDKPLVMTETMYEGTWFVPGGRSYAANLIHDAGGRYIWDDDTSAGSLQQSFETVLSRGANADFWFTHMYDEDLTIAGLEKKDSRYMLFAPAKNGNVWSVNTKSIPFYDETPFHPDLLLADYISIMHPELQSSPDTKYFKKAK